MKAAALPRSGGRRILVSAGWLLLVVVLAAGIMYGPELAGLIQLGRQIERIAAEEARAGGPWPRATDACIYCHGYEGNARAQTYPRLAGQPEAYLRKQLDAFADGGRDDPSMTPLALSMSEQERAAFAAHFARMTALPNTSFKADPARVARGEALARTGNCTSCHGQALAGKNDYPRLAGQGYDYLRDQLMRFKSGARRDPTGAMPALAGTLSQQDIDDLAQYMASR